MERYCEEKGKEVTFSTKIREDAPTQGNNVDCGVFVCQNAEKIAREVYVNTRQEEMDEARLTMMLEIYKGKLSAIGKADVREFVTHSAPTRRKKEKKDPRGKSEKKTRQKITKPEQPGRNRINWPQSNSKEWGRFEKDVASLLSLLDGPPERRAIHHPRIIF